MRFCFLTLQSLLLFFVLGDMCSSIGNNLATTDYVGENIFVNLVAIFGLVLLSALVGNMQVSTIVDIVANPACYSCWLIFLMCLDRKRICEVIFSCVFP